MLKGPDEGFERQWITSKHLDVFAWKLNLSLLFHKQFSQVILVLHNLNNAVICLMIITVACGSYVSNCGGASNTRFEMAFILLFPTDE